MERFSGALANYRLKLLVPALCEGRGESGVLVLERGAVRREFQLVDGCMISARSNEPREHLTQLLADLKILSATAAAEAYERAEASGTRFGKYLIDSNLVDRPRLLEAICHKAREAFFDCYLWENGTVSFEPGVAKADGVPVSMKLATLHRDGMARVREWRAFREVFEPDDLTFRVDREAAGLLAPVEDQLILHLAEAGATLGELLASGKEGRCAVARRLMRFYRQGVISPRAPGKVVGQSVDVVELISTARALLQQGKCEDAALVAERALLMAPVPEAHALYREAEIRVGLAISDEVFALEGKLKVDALPPVLPDDLTADDLYLHGKLRAAPSIRQAIRTAAMGELAAFRCVKRLVASGLVRVSGAAAPPRRQTDPYGMPAVPVPVR